MADNLTIRPVQSGDVAALREMRIEAVRDCPLGFTADLGETAGRPVEWWQDLVARNVGAGESVIMVADAGGGQLAGMTGLWAPRGGKLAHAGSIWGVYVRPLYRGQRIGDRLLHACLEWARRKGLVTVKLSVVEGNAAAQRCYERCGFKTYGVEPVAVQWEGQFYNEILMAVQLRKTKRLRVKSRTSAGMSSPAGESASAAPRGPALRSGPPGRRGWSGDGSDPRRRRRVGGVAGGGDEVRGR